MKGKEGDRGRENEREKLDDVANIIQGFNVINGLIRLLFMRISIIYLFSYFVRV